MTTPAQPLDCDVLITRATVLTMDDERRILEDGAVAVHGQRIVAVGPSDELKARFNPVRAIDASGRVVAPGFIDSHIHSSRHVVGGRPYQRAPRAHLLSKGGQVEAFVAELSAMHAVHADSELVHDATMALLISQIRGGTTAFLDAGGWNVDGVGAAVQEIGMRATLSPVACDLTPLPASPDTFPQRIHDADTLLAEMDAQVQRWHGAADGRIQSFASGVWSLNASDELLRGLASIARARGTGMHLHLAGVANEAAVSRRWFGLESIPRLAALDVLGPHFVAMHTYFSSDEDIRLLAESGAAVNQAPIGSALVGRGLGAARSLPRQRAAGIPIGLGSDLGGVAVTMFDVIRSALTVYRDGAQDDLALGVEEALWMATRGSARCLLRGNDLGAIAPGFLADLIILDVSGARYAVQPHPIPALGLLASPGDVETVIVDGQVLLDRGVLTTIDEERAIATARQAVRRFLAT